MDLAKVWTTVTALNGVSLHLHHARRHSNKWEYITACTNHPEALITQKAATEKLFILGRYCDKGI